MNEGESKTMTMVSDQEIAKGVEILLRHSGPHAVTSLNDVVQQLEANLGADLAHRADFIRDQINLHLRSYAPNQPPKDQFALQHFQQLPNSYYLPQQQQQFHPHFVLQQQPLPFQGQQHLPRQQLQEQALTPPPVVVKAGAGATNAAANGSETPKVSASTGTKRRGGSGGLNKVCGVSPELQAIVGEAALPRTEIVKQLWAYIRKHNLQDPGNKRKIMCDDALRLVFETDSTDMFKMNKLLAKHIISLNPTKQCSEAKKLKVERESATETTGLGPPTVTISDALAKFLGTGEREMLQSEALRRIWEYIKVNHLEDPLNSMVILCDAKLGELIGCESISVLGMPEMLARHHLFKQ